MGTQAVLSQRSTLLPVVERNIGSRTWLYSRRLLDILVLLQNPRLNQLRGSAKRERVVMHISVRNVGYVTEIEARINRCREGAYFFAYKLAVALFRMGD